MGISRRRFLEDSMWASAAAAAAAAAGSSRDSVAADTGSKASPNDVIRVAVVGVNGRGMSHVGGFTANKETQIVAICDADENVFAKAKKAVEQKTGKAPVFYQDIRKMLENKEIDAVSIATPNHWHALGAIWAIQAGKDVYVEKPISHNVLEGRMIAEFARKHGKIVQTGTQSRSNTGMRELIAAIHAGKIGKVNLARGLCYKPRKTIGKVTAATEVPKGIDYNLWLGPAAEKPVMRQRFHYDWHWQWDYGNGDLGNQGSHEMDKARWGLGKNEMPKKAFSLGGRFGYVDDGQTANTQLLFFDYGDSQLTFEVRGLDTPAYMGAKVGNIWHGSEGYAVSSNYAGGSLFDLKGNKLATFSGGSDQLHFNNFVKAVRSRKREDLTCEAVEGHLSGALCHLGNVSYQLGELRKFGAAPSCVTGSKDTADTFARFEEHLKENKIALDTEQYRMGKELSLEGESFTDKTLNHWLTREYRKGFEVPDKA